MINILPHNQKKIIHRLRVLRVATAVVVGATVLLGSAALLLFPTLVTINSRFALVEKQAAKVQTPAMAPQSTAITDLRSRATAIATKLAVALPPTPMDRINTIRAVGSEGVTMNAFSLDRTNTHTMVVSGVAINRTALQAFIARLEKEPSVVSVESPISNFVKNAESMFTIKVVFTKV